MTGARAVNSIEKTEGSALQKTGTVVSVRDDMIEVRFERPEACAKCGACSEGRKTCTTLTLRAQAQIGDEVVVELPEGRVAQASLLAYIVPLVFLVAGLLGAGPVQAALGLSIPQDLFAVALGLLGLGLSLLVLRAIEPHIRRRGRWQPRVVSITRKSS